MEVIEREVNFIPELNALGAFDPGSVLFFDIETTGLSKEKSGVYLIGCAYLSDGIWNIRQYFAENIDEEKLLLSEFIDFISGFDTVVHFNGDRFDVPYVTYRTNYYGINFDFNAFKSIDIFKSIKCARKLLGLSSLAQKALEEFLGVYREDELSGGRLVSLYFEYEKTKDTRIKDLLLLHNFDDMQGMLKILPVLNYLNVTEGAYSFLNASLEDETLILEFSLDLEVPVDIERRAASKRLLPDGNADEPDIDIFVSGNLLQINVSAYKGVGKYPLPDYKDYYYLPAEDEVIHKDVGQFVNRAHRIKASKNNCYVKKEGSFLPQYGDIFSPAFKVEGDKKRTYFEVSLVAEIKADMWEAYASQIIRHL